MMALFLVLWLLGSDEVTRQEVAKYFRGEPTAQGGRGQAISAKFGQAVNYPPVDMAGVDLLAIKNFNQSIENIRDQLNSSPEIGDDTIRFEFMADGVRINLIDRARKPFFESGTAQMTDFGKWIMKTIAWEVERHPFSVEIEGHVQGGGFAGTSPETDEGWQLSANRALSAQDALKEGGVPDKQFWRVAGYGDKKPLDKNDPASPDNRRVTIVIRASDSDELVKLKRQRE